MPGVLSTDELDRILREQLPAWTRDGNAIVRAIESETFAGGIRLVDDVALVADELDHHPDIDIRWTTATFRLSTHSAGGITQNDVALARRIDRLIADRGRD